ncbi:MAG: hypothetical protein PHD15_01745 [Clostridia bacterium]|nr:hypothetical protein [Clostridia bacterium]MDD4386474.1 hypothetical protein [Clostridia bacterium]
MECSCSQNCLDRGRGNILLLGEGKTYTYDYYIFVSCIKCGCSEEIYNRELSDVPAKKISVISTNFPYKVFVEEYKYVMQLKGSSQIQDDNIYDIMVAIIDAYRNNYYMYWEDYLFENVRQAIVKVLSLKKYDNCSKAFLAAMKKELKITVKETFFLEEFLKNRKSEDFDQESQKKYGPAGVVQIKCIRETSNYEKYLQKKIYLRTGQEIRSNIFYLQKLILQKMVKILCQNYKFKNYSELKIKGKISLKSIQKFVNDGCRDNIFLKGYSIVFKEIFDFEFCNSKDINALNYKEKLEKLREVNEFISRYLDN